MVNPRLKLLACESICIELILHSMDVLECIYVDLFKCESLEINRIFWWYQILYELLELLCWLVLKPSGCAGQKDNRAGVAAVTTLLSCTRTGSIFSNLHNSWQYVQIVDALLSQVWGYRHIGHSLSRTINWIFCIFSEFSWRASCASKLFLLVIEKIERAMSLDSCLLTTGRARV